MPRKKTITKDKKSQVQKQKIAARLLEISFKADDFIYKKKSISVEHAKKYLEEVEKFEPKCQGDVRSMQVIEKLTQLMKSIVAQGKASQGSDSQSSNPPNISSTNASILDSTLKSTRSIQVQTNSNLEIQKIIDHLENTDDFDKNNATDPERMQVTKTVNFDLERTLSNLSLSIIDPVNKDMFENIDQIESDLTFIDTQHFEKATMNEKKKSVSPDEASKDQSKHTNRDQIQNDAVEKTPPNIARFDDDESQKSIVNYIPINTAFLENYDEIIGKHNIGKNNPGIKTSVINDQSVVKHNIEKKKPNKESKKIDVTKTKNGPKKPGNNNKPKKNSNNTKPKTSRRNSKVKPDTILTEDVTENKNRRRNSTKPATCDLSWVENINFVREVETSEYTSMDLQDSFWDNCYLPYDCSQYF